MDGEDGSAGSGGRVVGGGQRGEEGILDAFDEHVIIFHF